MRFHFSNFEITRRIFTVSSTYDLTISGLKELLEPLNFKEVKKEENETSISVEYCCEKSLNSFFIWHWRPHTILYNQKKVSGHSYKIDIRTYFRLSSVLFQLCVLLILSLSDFYLINTLLKLEHDVSNIGSFNKAFYYLVLATVFLIAWLVWSFRLVNISTKHGEFLDRTVAPLLNNGNENTIIELGGRRFPPLSLLVLIYDLLWGAFLLVYIDAPNTVDNSLLRGIQLVVFFLLAVFLLAGVLMVVSIEIQTRMNFIVIGLWITMPYAIFYNYPILFRGLIPEFQERMLRCRAIEAIYHELEQPPNLTNGYNFLKNSQLRFNQGAFVIFLVLASLSLLLVLSLKLEYLRSVIEKFKLSNKNSIYHNALLKFQFFPVFSVLVFLFWLSISVAVCTATFLNVVLTFILFCPKHVSLPLTVFDNFIFLLQEQYTFLAARVPIPSFISYKSLLFLYLLPFWLFLTPLFVLKGRDLKRKRKFYRSFSKACTSDNRIDKIVSELSNYLEVPKPKVYFNSSLSIQANTRFLGFLRSNGLSLSRGALLYLSESEQIALLAHEMYHIKRHNVIWSFLQFLSEITLFGKGFLSAILNSYELEFSADRFALDWLTRQNRYKSDLIHLLQVTEAVNTLHLPSPTPEGQLNWQIVGGSRNRIERIKQSMQNTFHTLYLLYFSGQILSYIHPSINERIAAINNI